MLYLLVKLCYNINKQSPFSLSWRLWQYKNTSDPGGDKMYYQTHERPGYFDIAVVYSIVFLFIVTCTIFAWTEIHNSQMAIKMKYNNFPARQQARMPRIFSEEKQVQDTSTGIHGTAVQHRDNAPADDSAISQDQAPQARSSTLTAGWKSDHSADETKSATEKPPISMAVQKG